MKYGEEYPTSKVELVLIESDDVGISKDSTHALLHVRVVRSLCEEAALIEDLIQ